MNERRLYSTTLNNEIIKDHIKVLGASSEGMFECFVCQCSISGLSQAEGHVLGGRHHKKLKIKTDPQVGRPLSAYENQNMITINAEILQENHSNAFFCTICDKDFTGPIPLQAHLDGKQHAKAVNIQAHLRNQETKLEETSRVEEMNISQRKVNFDGEYICKLCTMEFTGHIPLKYHLDGKLHAKFLALNSQTIQKDPKVPRTELMQLEELNSGQRRNNNEKYFCEVCDISFTGPVPLKDHVIGKLHAKSMQRQGNNSNTSITSNDDEKELFVPLPKLQKTSLDDFGFTVIECNEPVPKLF